MDKGWWCYWRKMQDDPLWEPKRPRTKYEAWLDLISRAKWTPGRDVVGYSLIPLERGQVIFSIHSLARDWNWSRGKVRRFLELIEKEERINVNRGCSEGDSKPYPQADPPWSILTIANFSRYNDPPKKTDQQADQKRTSSGPIEPSNQETREGKDGSDLKYPTVLNILHGIEGWPIDPKKDDNLIHRNKEKHNLTIDQLEQAAIELATWYDDSPGEIEKPKANPRMRFITFAKNRAKWDRESGLSGGAGGDGQSHRTITVGRIRQDLTSYLMRAARGEMDFEEFEAAILKRYDGQSIDPEAIQGAWDLAQREFDGSDRP